MKINYIGVIIKDEPRAMFSVDFEIDNNGVQSLGTLEISVACAMINVNESRELAPEEVEMAEDGLKDELKTILGKLIS